MQLREQAVAFGRLEIARIFGKVLGLAHGIEQAESLVDCRVVKELVAAVVDHSHVGRGATYAAANAEECKPAGQYHYNGGRNAPAAGKAEAARGYGAQGKEQRGSRKGYCRESYGKVCAAHAVGNGVGRIKVGEHRGVKLEVPKRVEARVAHEQKACREREYGVVDKENFPQPGNAHPDVDEQQEQRQGERVACGGKVERKAVHYYRQEVAGAATAPRSAVEEHENGFPQRKEKEHYSRKAQVKAECAFRYIRRMNFYVFRHEKK